MFHYLGGYCTDSGPVFLNQSTNGLIRLIDVVTDAIHLKTIRNV